MSHFQRPFNARYAGALGFWSTTVYYCIYFEVSEHSCCACAIGGDNQLRARSTIHTCSNANFELSSFPRILLSWAFWLLWCTHHTWTNTSSFQQKVVDLVDSWKDSSCLSVTGNENLTRRKTHHHTMFIQQTGDNMRKRKKPVPAAMSSKKSSKIEMIVRWLADRLALRIALIATCLLKSICQKWFTCEILVGIDPCASTVRW